MRSAGDHLATFSDVPMGLRQQPERTFPKTGRLRRLQECCLHPSRHADLAADGLPVYVAFAETPNEQGQPHHAVLPVDQHPPGSVQLLLDAVDAVAVAHLLHCRHRKGHPRLPRGGRRGLGPRLSRTDAADQVVVVVAVDRGRNRMYIKSRCFFPLFLLLTHNSESKNREFIQFRNKKFSRTRSDCVKIVVYITLTQLFYLF